MMASRPSMIRAAPVRPLASAVSVVVVSRVGAVVTGSDIAGLAQSKSLGGSHTGDSVDDDRGQDEQTHDRLLPELVDPKSSQRAGDRGEQNRSDSGADDRAAAAEDGHPADDGRRDDAELEAGS